MDLIIVESPSKAKTISKYLKGKYQVDASGGHVRDLPEKTLGVKIKANFEPTYEITPSKEEVIKRLKVEAAKASKVYLATDPDREGEAISWHLQTVLGLDEQGENRIEFNEISPNAVKKALQKPRKINYNLVDAQQARRVLDRLVGYKLSPLLNRHIQDGLSAGRVQSVALRMIVDREREILSFKPEEYWTFTATLQDGDKKYCSFKAVYNDKKAGESITASQADQVEKAVKKANWVVTKVQKGVVKRHAPAPFTTSSLQQDASNKFSMSSPETMLVAQHLYEGMEIDGDHLALITYIRTDSVRVSKEAQDAALDFIQHRYGSEYVPEKPNFYATKKNAQDAHEAIRPINLDITPESLKKSLDKKHYNIYKLVYDRFLASQMAEAQYNSMQIEADAAGYTFRASGRSLLFAGYTEAYQEHREEEEESGKLLPPLEQGQQLILQELLKEQKFTRPPQRYTDASLVKAMEEKGIGRPSTYASIISVLTKRKYVAKDAKDAKGGKSKYMVPTEIAFEITDFLVKYFVDIMDIGFTANMEENLDKIEEEGIDWHKVIVDFYPSFVEHLNNAAKDGEELTDKICEKCGSPMMRRCGKFGKYLACTNYPACSNMVSESPVKIFSAPCPKCGGEMHEKSGKFGLFWACSNYPNCSMIIPNKAEPTNQKCPECNSMLFSQETKTGTLFKCFNCNYSNLINKDGESEQNSDPAGICPQCKKPMARRFSKKGKIFFGCTGYPNCKFLSWDATTGDICPKCKEPLILKDNKIKCSNKECGYSPDDLKKEKGKSTKKNSK